MQLGSAGQFFRARIYKPYVPYYCFARNVTSSLLFKVHFRSHCTLERSKPLLIRPVPQVQKSTSWTTLTVLTHLRTAPEERVLVRPLQRSELERGPRCDMKFFIFMFVIIWCKWSEIWQVHVHALFVLYHSITFWFSNFISLVLKCPLFYICWIYIKSKSNQQIGPCLWIWNFS